MRGLVSGDCVDAAVVRLFDVGVVLGRERRHRQDGRVRGSIKQWTREILCSVMFDIKGKREWRGSRIVILGCGENYKEEIKREGSAEVVNYLG